MKKEIIGYKNLHEENVEYICPKCGKPSWEYEYVPKIFGHSYHKYECNNCGCIWKVKMSW